MRVYEILKEADNNPPKEISRMSLPSIIQAGCIPLCVDAIMQELKNAEIVSDENMHQRSQGRAVDSRPTAVYIPTNDYIHANDKDKVQYVPLHYKSSGDMVKHKENEVTKVQAATKGAGKLLKSKTLVWYNTVFQKQIYPYLYWLMKDTGGKAFAPLALYFREHGAQSTEWQASKRPNYEGPKVADLPFETFVKLPLLIRKIANSDNLNDVELRNAANKWAQAIDIYTLVAELITMGKIEYLNLDQSTPEFEQGKAKFMSVFKWNTENTSYINIIKKLTAIRDDKAATVVDRQKSNRVKQFSKNQESQVNTVIKDAIMQLHSRIGKDIDNATFTSIINTVSEAANKLLALQEVLSRYNIKLK